MAGSNGKVATLNTKNLSDILHMAYVRWKLPLLVTLRTFSAEFYKEALREAMSYLSEIHY